MSNKLSIQNYLYTFYTNGVPEIEVFRKTLFENGIHTKFDTESGLVIAYYPFHTNWTDEKFRDCRSIIFEYKTGNIILHTGNEIYLNEKGLEYLQMNNKMFHEIKDITIHNSYEGPGVNLYYYNEEWHVSTRRCLDAKQAKINKKSSFEATELMTNYYDLFIDVLSKEGEDFATFTNKLSKDCSYYFVIIHHLETTIDYTDEFGPDYKVLVLTSVKNKTMKTITDYDNNFLSTNVKTPKPTTLESMDLLDSMEINDKKPTIDGVFITIQNDTDYPIFIKLQTLSSQFHNNIANHGNTLKGLLFLEQKNKLSDYYKNTSKQVIKNPLNNEEYNMMEMVRGVFSCLAQELYNLFTRVYEIKNGKHKNTGLYNKLKEYRMANIYVELLYKIKGVYYQKRNTFFSTIKNVTKDTHGNYNNKMEFLASHLNTTDIYKLLQDLTTTELHTLLGSRKLMGNLSRSTEEDCVMKEFTSISRFEGNVRDPDYEYKLMCSGKNLKHCNTFTSMLFPTLTSSDLPPAR